MSRLPSVIPKRDLVALDQHIGAFESEVQSVIQRTSPRSEHAILLTLGIMLLLSLLLMAVIKLDRVVAAPGEIVTTQGSLYVQPLDRAVVRSILVKPGDVVRKGQVLANLDPTFAAASETQLSAKVDSAQDLVNRLQAEREGKPFAPSDSGDLQGAVWRERQQEYRNTLADYDARIAASTAAIAHGTELVGQLQQKRDLATNVEQMKSSLREKGYVSRVQEIAAQQDKISAEQNLTQAQGQLAQYRNDLQGLRAQRALFVSKWRDDYTTNLVNARNDLEQYHQDLSKARRVKELIKLTAPADAVVLQIGNVSNGAVVEPQAGAPPMFTLVPLGSQLEAEARVDSKDIGFIKAGDKVAIKLDAYNFIQHGIVHGVIKSISEGSFTGSGTQQARSPYFIARIAIRDAALRNVPKSFRIIPGMTVQADVLVGKRTILSYITTGILRTGSEAMREP